ncbi:MAG: phosphoglycolate phosphatase [Janthinobacterium lividum]
MPIATALLSPGPARLLVLDLDGTLVDTIPDLLACANRMLDQRSLAPITVSELRPMVGDGVPALVQRILHHRGVPCDDRAIAAYTADYTAHAADFSRLFPGIADMLQEAIHAGWRLAVCTNKPVAAARALLAALGIDELFAAIGGGDSFASRKPDPAHLLATIAAAQGSPHRSVMVGDHHNDVAAARGTGIPSIFVGWGYGSAETGQDADATVADPSQVMASAHDVLRIAVPAQAERN